MFVKKSCFQLSKLLFFRDVVLVVVLNSIVSVMHAFFLYEISTDPYKYVSVFDLLSNFSSVFIDCKNSLV